jgi:hypothetical protein
MSPISFQCFVARTLCAPNTRDALKQAISSTPGFHERAAANPSTADRDLQFGIAVTAASVDLPPSAGHIADALSGAIEEHNPRLHACQPL